jgi:hypothetical protein
MYKTIINDLDRDTNYHNSWPFDQYYISKYIFENKEHFVIFVPDILNTPIGKVLRHNWLKNQKMYNDLNTLIELKNEDIHIDKKIFVETYYYDNNIFPNTIETGYGYFE